MKRRTKLVFSITGIILGWLLIAFALTTELGHPKSTISLFFGLAFVFSGVVFLVLNNGK